MGNLRTSLLVILVLALAVAATAQTWVSTQPETRNAVVEEFGGIYCVYCPHGHQILQELLDGPLGDHIIPINYHAGLYAQPIADDPNYTTPIGEALNDVFNLSGYPAAAINRQHFPDLAPFESAIALGRSHWGAAIEEVTATTAIVNLGGVATTNISDRTVTLELEYFYLEDPPAIENRLHIAVVQNNVLGPQHGNSTNHLYLHQRLFRRFVTGPEGQLVNTPTAGTFGGLTFDIDLPEAYNDVIVDPANIELVAFITDGQGVVLNGLRISPTLETTLAVDVQLLNLIAEDDFCALDINSQVILRNDGTDPLTSCDLVFGIDGVTFNQHHWTGELAFLETIAIDLPEVAASPDSLRGTLVVTALQPNTQED
ncbi:MAG: Omp28-related outer membrane protein, partial [Bacteroidota bacterium]